jgi:hypothetical protein
MIGMMADTFGSEFQRGDRKNLLFVINGRSWPNTERLTYNMSDTIRWRVLNVTSDPRDASSGAYYFVESLTQHAIRQSPLTSGRSLTRRPCCLEQP